MKKINPLTIDQTANLGLDEDGNLYWKNQQIKTKQRVELSTAVSLAVIATALATITQAVCAVLILLQK
ncbi:hypothetical protein OH491_15675 [Termitidicoccus mucosus]|uniref:hypothetical protein n=1 Tax=Termitidicoccus mucosus TaxID=1184151 RepID=UPI0011AB56B5